MKVKFNPHTGEVSTTLKRWFTTSRLELLCNTNTLFGRYYPILKYRSVTLFRRSFMLALPICWIATSQCKSKRWMGPWGNAFCTSQNQLLLVFATRPINFSVSRMIPSVRHWTGPKHLLGYLAPWIWTTIRNYKKIKDGLVPQLWLSAENDGPKVNNWSGFFNCQMTHRARKEKAESTSQRAFEKQSISHIIFQQRKHCGSLNSEYQ